MRTSQEKLRSIHSYNNISLNLSYNEKCFRQML
jgi:hypothetical protein